MQLLNRKPPFGLEVLASVKELPQYYAKHDQLEVRTSDGKGPVEIDLSIECGLVDKPGQKKAKKGKNWSLNMTSILTVTSDMDLVDFRRISYVGAI